MAQNLPKFYTTDYYTRLFAEYFRWSKNHLFPAVFWPTQKSLVLQCSAATYGSKVSKSIPKVTHILYDGLLYQAFCSVLAFAENCQNLTPFIVYFGQLENH